MSGVRELARRLIEEGVRWVDTERQRLRPQGRALTAQERQLVDRDVEAIPVLDDVRVVVVGSLWNPPFFTRLSPQERSSLVDFGSMDAITFVDTVVVREAVAAAWSMWRPILFHEFVHVAQYAILGVDGFVEDYVNGYLDNDSDYERIPLEKMAFDLQRRFEQRAPVALAQEVRRLLL